MSDFKFVSGEFTPYRIDNPQGVHIGKLQRNLEYGAVVGYDGMMLRIGNEDHLIPEMRAVIKVGWMVRDVPAEATTEAATPEAPVEPRVKVRPATAAATRTREEPFKVEAPAQREVATLKPPAAATPEAKRFNATLVVKDPTEQQREVRKFSSPSKPTVVAPSQQAVVAGTFRTATSSTIRLDGSTTQAEVPEGVRAPVVTRADAEGATRVVARARVAPATTNVVLDSTAAAAAVESKLGRSINNRLATVVGDHVVSLEGDRTEDLAPALNPEDRAALVAAQRRKAADASQAKVEAEEAAVAAPPPPVVVAPVKKRPQTIEEVIVNDGIIQVAPGVFWDKTIHWSSRVKKALTDHADQPAVIEAICAIEAPAVVAGIRKGLAAKAAVAAP